MRLQPSEIRYSQDSISINFYNIDSGTILDLFEEILSGNINVAYLNRIEVGYHEGFWVAFEGNRRLFVLKVRVICFKRSK